MPFKINNGKLFLATCCSEYDSRPMLRRLIVWLEMQRAVYSYNVGDASICRMWLLLVLCGHQQVHFSAPCLQYQQHGWVQQQYRRQLYKQVCVCVCAFLLTSRIVLCFVEVPFCSLLCVSFKLCFLELHKGVLSKGGCLELHTNNKFSEKEQGIIYYQNAQYKLYHKTLGHCLDISCFTHFCI